MQVTVHKNIAFFVRLLLFCILIYCASYYMRSYEVDVG